LSWAARTYTRIQPAIPPSALTFDQKLIPEPVSRDVHLKTQAELKALAEKLAEQDAKLAAERERNAALQAELTVLQAQVAAAKAANLTRPDTHDYDEQTTRVEYIDVLLQKAGWPLDQPCDREIKVTVMPNASGNGYVHYVQ